jgi:Na+/melibiose symporter-like transporter
VLDAGPDEDLSLGPFWRTLRGHANFWVFVGVNLLQVFNCHFNSNFLAVSLDRFFTLGSSAVPSSLLLSVAAVAPHAVVVLVAPLLRRYGIETLFRSLLLLKIVIASIALLLLSPEESRPLHIAAFFLANKVFTEAICRHGNLLVADLIDEEAAMHPGRVASRSSLYFGAVALFTKPGQALAAMVGFFALQTGAPLFRIVTVVPAACGVLQLLLFARFHIGRKHVAMKAL